MPIFEYLCSECGTKTEKILNRSLEQIVCPNCGSKARKIISLFASSVPETGGRCAPSSGSGFG